MRSIDFVIIGAQKSGTTSLAYRLSQHPQINFCKHKEPNFFSKSDDWQLQLSEYHQLYEFSAAKILGEASTTYSWFPQYPHTANNLFAYNPDIKIIYIMRQPVERVISHYTHRLLRARTKSDQDLEVFENPIYVNRSRYAMQLKPYLELFPRESILLLTLEEFSSQPAKSHKMISEHLGIDEAGFQSIDLTPQYASMTRTGDKKIKKALTPVARLFPLKVRNALRGPFVYQLDSKIAFSEETKKLLWQLLENDVEAIENLMSRKLDVWRQAPYSNQN